MRPPGRALSLVTDAAALSFDGNGPGFLPGPKSGAHRTRRNALLL